jgi:pimeloyl-ACP methyl ester carboxylesterase
MVSLSNALDAFAEVHIMDFSGHGEARWPEEAFSMETFEADVLRFMEARGLKAAHLFGYSMGGFVALRLAAKYPERVLTVTTLATKLAWTEETCAKESSMLNADAMESKVPKFVNALASVHPRAGWRKIVENTQQLIQDMYKCKLSADEMGQIKQPVRLMVGDRDKMVSMGETIDAYRALPNGALCILPETPHPLENANKPLLASLIQPMLSKAPSEAFNLMA